MSSPSFFSNGSTPLPQDTLLVTTKKILGSTIDGGGGGSGQLVTYTSNPNSEALKPTNLTSPAFAYKASGVGTIYQWNVGTQTWI